MSSGTARATSQKRGMGRKYICVILSVAERFAKRIAPQSRRTRLSSRRPDRRREFLRKLAGTRRVRGINYLSRTTSSREFPASELTGFAEKGSFDFDEPVASRQARLRSG